MEEEAEKLKELQNEVEKQMNLSPPPSEFVFVSVDVCQMARKGCRRMECHAAEGEHCSQVPSLAKTELH